MTVYMPSYFNEYPERKELFKNSIESYLKLGFDIVIFWMNSDDDKIIDEKVKYIDSKDILNASIARNILLEIFYESDDNEAILSDDDVIMTRNNSYDGYDVLSLTNDYNSALKETYLISSSLLRIKNLNKIYGKKIFFDESLDANQDVDFGCNCVNEGIKTYRLKDTGIKINRGKSAMFTNPMNRLVRKHETLKIITKKWNLSNNHGI